MSHLRLHRKGARRSSLFVSAPATPERHRESEPLLMSQTIDYGNTSLNSVRTTFPSFAYLMCTSSMWPGTLYSNNTPADSLHRLCIAYQELIQRMARCFVCVVATSAEKLHFYIYKFYPFPSHISHPPQKRFARVQLHVHIRGDYCLIRFFFGGRGWVAGL